MEVLLVALPVAETEEDEAVVEVVLEFANASILLFPQTMVFLQLSC